MNRQRVAVIGAGVAGLSAAWLLRRDHDVTLFEADHRAGGHADTQQVMIDGQPIAVDTGFIVLNDRNYPNFTALLAAIGVPTQPSEMSFSASIGNGAFEYGGGTIRQLFTQRSNVFKPRFWRMLRDIMRFYRQAPALLHAPGDETLGDFLTRGRYSDGFIRDHILPMGGAIWSASLNAMRDFPARQFAQFFHNHGLLTLNDRPNWRTVTGGSRVYVASVLADLAASGHVRLGCGVRAIRRTHTVQLDLADGTTQDFDQAVLACHADQALALLDAPTEAERRTLGAVRCADNVAILHSDTSLMPRRRGVWSAWNYLSDGGADQNRPVSLTYWMNCLQNLKTRTPLFVTLNPQRQPAPHLVHTTRHYRHPQFDQAAIAAQQALPSIQGQNRLWFTGAWTGWGFHEDGIAASVRVAEAMGVEVPWADGEARPGALPLDPAGVRGPQTPFTGVRATAVARDSSQWGLGSPDPSGGPMLEKRGGKAPWPCLPSSQDTLLLHTGRMAHVRHRPFRHKFGYRLWMASVDLDRIGAPLFAHNRFGVLSLHDRDHGPRDGSALRPWVQAQLDRAGLGAYGASVRFMFIPRVFGWAFNPIAFFFCHDAAGRLGAVLHQVKNTFGDQHAYLLPADPHRPSGALVRQQTAKRMHVSPFFDLDGGYQFAFRAPDFAPGGRFDLTLRYGADQQPRLTATMHLATKQATPGAILSELIRQPLMPIKVVAAIHFQALRLWLRGAKFHTAPPAQAEPVSLGGLS